MKATISDFCTVNKAVVSSTSNPKNRTGYYWTKTDDGDGDACRVDDLAVPGWDDVRVRCVGARPAVSFSSIRKQITNQMRANDGILEVEWGEYPQKAASKEKQQLLEELYKCNELSSTGKSYTIDFRKYREYDEPFAEEKVEEFVYQGKKYARVIADTFYDGNKVKLSNGELYRDGYPVWIEVNPVKWLVDEENDIAITKDIISSGILFNKKRGYKGNFEETEMYRYLNKHVINDLIPSQGIRQEKEVMNTCIKLITLLGKRALETNAKGILKDLNLTESEKQALVTFLSKQKEDPEVISSFMSQINDPAEEKGESHQSTEKQHSLILPKK